MEGGNTKGGDKENKQNIDNQYSQYYGIPKPMYETSRKVNLTSHEKEKIYAELNDYTPDTPRTTDAEDTEEDTEEDMEEDTEEDTENINDLEYDVLPDFEKKLLINHNSYGNNEQDELSLIDSDDSDD